MSKSFVLRRLELVEIPRNGVGEKSGEALAIEAGGSEGNAVLAQLVEASSRRVLLVKTVDLG